MTCFPKEHFERVERQLERTNSLCELLVTEQRRLAMVTDSLHSAVLDLQGPRQNPFYLSNLPMNSTWSDVNAASDVQMLGQAVNQCCHLLTQLQRDLVTVQQSCDGMNAQSQTLHQGTHCLHGFAEGGRATDCNMDRLDPGVTLNNRVPPGNRNDFFFSHFISLLLSLFLLIFAICQCFR